ncbi:MAG: hypothetical protein CMI09_07905 [Oceanospirillaceae bacterium]|nr:hypothetical protein [Oceanospirillaceae bacterium]|tara:strand:+ start:1213 stop:1437 length:225 start_codon:yes stop_codon:yes gene_type:complete
MSDVIQSLQQQLSTVEQDLNNTKAALQEKLEKLEKGLFFMSVDRERALSVHETVDLIEELRETVSSARADLDKI